MEPLIQIFLKIMLLSQGTILGIKPICDSLETFNEQVYFLFVLPEDGYDHVQDIYFLGVRHVHLVYMFHVRGLWSHDMD